MSESVLKPPYSFLSGAGEMATLTREKNWDETAVGPIAHWPQSLKTVLGLLLKSKFPMFLFWGPELVCFYNDAYRPSLGKEGKHPHMLGQKAADAWPEIWPVIKPMLDHVLQGGEATWSEDQLIPIFRNGQMEDVYWTFSYSAVNDESGGVGGVFVTCTETTQKVNLISNLQATEKSLKDTLAKLEATDKRFRSTVQQAPLGITILRGPDFVPEMANRNYLELVDRTEADFVGKPLFDSLPSARSVAEPLLRGVLESGKAFYASELSVVLNRYGKEELAYFNLVYHPLRDDYGKVSGIMVVAIEVTESAKAKQALTESENRFRNLVMLSPIAKTILRGRDFVIEMANPVMLEQIWQKTEAEVYGKKLLDLFPELKAQKYADLLNRIFETGEMVKESQAVGYIQREFGLQRMYLDYQYTPLFESDGEVSGIMVTINDVTERVEAHKKVQDAEERLRLATEATDLSTWDLDLLTREIVHSDRLTEILGYPKGTKIDHAAMRAQVHPDDLVNIVEPAFELALRTSIYRYEARLIKANGQTIWIRTQGKIFFDPSGMPVKMIGTLRDITEEKLRQQELQESEAKFRLLADSLPQHIWTTDPEGRISYYNQSVSDYSGLDRDILHEVGWMEIVHPDEKIQNQQAWAAALKSGKDFLFEHRLRHRDGAYRWHLSRGIPQRDSSGNIQMWVGTSTDIHEQKSFLNELEKQVQERTKELQKKNSDLEKMNAELQSFAYVSSHDLQEPLRKIQTFASRLIEKEYDTLSENAKDYFSRMQLAANRMQTLILDLLAYSRTSTSDLKFVETDLREPVNEVIHELRESIEEKKALVKVGHLDTVPIVPFQFVQLVQNLLANALKFTRPGTAPEIRIGSQRVTGLETGIDALQPNEVYCHLTIADNGIGFEPQYAERIFEVFQRLHGKSEYTGTGIGLAIVRKIVLNHNGHIRAEGKPGAGAVFHVYLPLVH